jgi:signal transduction histidine kinase
VLWRMAQREQSGYISLLLCASLMVYALGAHDWVTQRDILSFSEPYKLHFGAPILFSVVAWNMFNRFRGAQRAAEHLALTLEQLVMEKSAELEKTYKKMGAIEASRAQELERERIMQDMHDGLGSQLVSSLAMVQAGNISNEQVYEVLRACIDDLRLAVDSSSREHSTLNIALGNLRFRMEPRLKAAGLGLEWEVGDEVENLVLAQPIVLPLLRVIQECITNALKHSGAKILRISVHLQADSLILKVGDDGVGFDTTLARGNARGKGLNGMEKRSRTLGASIGIESSGQGTIISLNFPLNQRAPV